MIHSHPILPEQTEHPVINAMRQLQEAVRTEEACLKDMMMLPRGTFEELYPKSMPEDIAFERIDRKVDLYKVLAEYGVDLGIIVRGAV